MFICRQLLNWDSIPHCCNCHYLYWSHNHWSVPITIMATKFRTSHHLHWQSQLSYWNVKKVIPQKSPVLTAGWRKMVASPEWDSLQHATAHYIVARCFESPQGDWQLPEKPVQHESPASILWVWCSFVFPNAFMWA